MIDLTSRVKNYVLSCGANLVGICWIDNLAEEHRKKVLTLLPEAKTAVVFVCRHSYTAMASENINILKFDTLTVYENINRISLGLVRFLEDEGFKAMAIPPYLPIEMSKETSGLIGDVSLRHLAVEAGLGILGLNRLLITKDYGPRVRIGAVLTSANLNPDKKLEDNFCNNCKLCIKSCPVKAIGEDGILNVRKCAANVLKYGLPTLIRFIPELAGKSKDEISKIIRDPLFWNIWQTLTLGAFYECFECIKVCPIGERFPV